MQFPPWPLIKFIHRPGGEIGILVSLKMRWLKSRAGSTPAPGITIKKPMTIGFLIRQAQTATIKLEVNMFNDDEPKQPPPHVYTKEERETFETINALLQNGGKVIEGHELINDPEKGSYYRIEIQQGDQRHEFELKIPFPVIFFPWQCSSPLK